MTSSSKSSVEIVARGMAQAIGDPDGLEPGDDPYGNNQSTIDGYNSNGEPCHFFWRGYVGTAQAALSAITEAGYAVVPLEPTEPAVYDGAMAVCAFAGGDTFHASRWMGHAKEAYRAMLAASPIHREGEKP